MANDLLNKTLWTEGFRPKSLDAVILLPRVRAILEKGLTNNILFEGTPGTGKTTITRILSEGHDSLYVNASLERGIDVIRQKIISFCSQASLIDGPDKMKIVQLEECDNMSEDAWKSLRAVIEQYHKTVRFVANCNYINKIPAPIQSRFLCVHLEPLNAQEEEELVTLYLDRTKKILTTVAGVQASDEDLRKLVMSYFPDLRSIIKKCQELKDSGVTVLNSESLVKSFDNSELFGLLISPAAPWDNYRYIVQEWGSRPDEAMLSIGRDFPEYLRVNHPSLGAYLPYVLKAIATYQAMMPQAIDKLIPVLGLVSELQIMFAASK